MTIGEAIWEPEVDPTTSIWRYLSARRFDHLLQNSALWLARADKLGDSHEGSLPFGSSTEVLIEFVRKMRPDLSEAYLQGHRDQIQRLAQRVILFTYANCWAGVEHESELLWKKFAPGNDAVAVRSTVQRLIDADQSSHLLHCVGVRYLDYDTDVATPPGIDPTRMADSLAPFVCKRREFAAEHEVRLLTQEWEPGLFGYGDPGPEGHAMAVSLPTLIEEVRLAPTSDRADLRRVQAAVTDVGLDPAIVRPSSLARPPRF